MCPLDNVYSCSLRCLHCALCKALALVVFCRPNRISKLECVHFFVLFFCGGDCCPQRWSFNINWFCVPYIESSSRTRHSDLIAQHIDDYTISVSIDGTLKPDRPTHRPLACVYMIFYAKAGCATSTVLGSSANPGRRIVGGCPSCCPPGYYSQCCRAVAKMSSPLHCRPRRRRVAARGCGRLHSITFF